MWALIEQAETLRAELTAAVDEDAAAFEAVMAAFKLPKDTEEQQAARNAAVQQATFAAAQVPLTVARRAVQVMDLALQAAQLGNLNAISDAGSGVALGRAALTGAGMNVRINLLGLDDQTPGAPLLLELAELEHRANRIESELRLALKERAGLELK